MRISLLRLFILFSFLFALQAVKAQGDLLVTPKRLVFDGSKRTEEINLANIGKDTATYTISFMQYRMDESGAFVALTEADSAYKFASKNLRFFPRTVTLAPNEAQSVKVQLIKSNELAPGEYRSHLFFKNTYTTAALGEVDTTSKNAGISVSLKPSFGLSIATIIRIGSNNTSGTISNALFTASETNPMLDFTINRIGNFSLYGDVKVSHVSPAGTRTEVAIMKGLAVYTSAVLRKVKVPLNKIPTVDYKQGILQVEYLEPQSQKAVIAAATVTL